MILSPELTSCVGIDNIATEAYGKSQPIQLSIMNHFLNCLRYALLFLVSACFLTSCVTTRNPDGTTASTYSPFGAPSRPSQPPEEVKYVQELDKPKLTPDQNRALDTPLSKEDMAKANQNAQGTSTQAPTQINVTAPTR
jgi:hypothetical protein